MGSNISLVELLSSVCHQSHCGTFLEVSLMLAFFAIVAVLLPWLSIIHLKLKKLISDSWIKEVGTGIVETFLFTVCFKFNFLVLVFSISVNCAQSSWCCNNVSKRFPLLAKSPGLLTQVFWSCHLLTRNKSVISRREKKWWKETLWTPCSWTFKAS